MVRITDNSHNLLSSSGVVFRLLPIEGLGYEGPRNSFFRGAIRSSLMPEFQNVSLYRRSEETKSPFGENGKLCISLIPLYF
jgi:hypothetical protein